jgi:hypothetical protein
MVARPGVSAMNVATEALSAAVDRLAPRARMAVLKALNGLLSSEAMQPAIWRRTWRTLGRTVAGPREPARAASARDPDDFGFDADFYHALRPVASAFYHHWFRVAVEGIAHVPLIYADCAVNNGVTKQFETHFAPDRFRCSQTILLLVFEQRFDTDSQHSRGNRTSTFKSKRWYYLLCNSRQRSLYSIMEVFVGLSNCFLHVH